MTTTVYRPGAKVKIGPADNPIPARIASILIEPGDHVSYKVSWWDGRSHHAEWLNACEVTGTWEEERKIGYHVS